jgi:hypothetical protein
MTTALRAVAIVAISVCAGIGATYLSEAGVKTLGSRNKPVELFIPFAAAVATGLALLRIGKRQ